MTYAVRLSHQAIRDLASIYRDKHAETSPPAATWFLGLRDTILSLKEFPLRGAVTREDPTLRHLLYGNRPHIYRIIYSINEEAQTINVAQVRHGARQPVTSK